MKMADPAGPPFLKNEAFASEFDCLGQVVPTGDGKDLQEIVNDQPKKPQNHGLFSFLWRFPSCP